MYKLKLLKVNILVEAILIRKNIMIIIGKIGEDIEYKKKLKELKNLKKNLILNIKKEEDLAILLQLNIKLKEKKIFQQKNIIDFKKQKMKNLNIKIMLFKKKLL